MVSLYDTVDSKTRKTQGMKRTHIMYENDEGPKDK